jgi:UDP-N-acetylmuramoylalanine--D-glutamate ligase
MIDPRRLFSGKKITVMGLGLLGRGLKDTQFLVKCGAEVTVTDLKTADQLQSSLDQLQGLHIKFRLGVHDPDDFRKADMILRNADVPQTSPFLKIAEENGVPVEMDESLFCKHFAGKVVGITGTRGKTTTTTLTHKILSRGNANVFLAGNIMGCATLPLLAEATEQDIVVLELSSWQLQGFHKARMSPQASVFTNIYPDHLNRYNGMEDYTRDKKAIFMYQTDEDFCLFNGDQPEMVAMASEARAAKGFFSEKEVPAEWSIKLPGSHNRQNIAAAIGLASRLGVSMEKIRDAVESFDGVEHRLQWLGEVNGVGFINDSTSTTPVAGCVALNSVKAKRILLIAGGADKKLDLTPFALEAVKRSHKIALLEGSATEKLKSGIIESGGQIKISGVFQSLGDAVENLLSIAERGDMILLSPGCASFGMFKNEFHRGETFVEIFKRLSGHGR